jgi:phosphoribosylanthranilate isomerase
MVKIKVCGITNLEDALAAIEFGADYLGFNFYPPSSRCITPEKAREMIARLPAAIEKFALFVNEPKERVREVLAAGAADGKGGFSGVQLHGEETPDYCRGWDLKIIKAFRVKDRDSLQSMADFPADYYLVDSWAPGYGGSGAPFPWSWLEGLKAEKLILAGGLHADNVAEAIRLVRPYGVDVCTGVEAQPGIKDHAKLKAFISAVQSA